MNRLVILIPCGFALTAFLAGTAPATEKVKVDVKADAVVQTAKPGSAMARAAAAAKKAAAKKAAAEKAKADGAKFACMTTADCAANHTGIRSECYLSPDGTAGRCGNPALIGTRVLPSQILIVNQNNFLILCCQDHIQSCCPESDYDGN